MIMKKDIFILVILDKMPKAVIKQQWYLEKSR